LFLLSTVFEPRAVRQCGDVERTGRGSDVMPTIVTMKWLNVPQHCLDVCWSL